MNVLEVERLNIWEERTGTLLVHNIAFSLAQGECLAIVGESGSGKSLTCKALMRLKHSGVLQSGRIALKGIDLAQLSDKEMRKYRGRGLCMIMQNGMRAFDPSRRLGVFLLEALAAHFDWSRSEMTFRLSSAMLSVGLNNPPEVMRRYPHQLSGGMLQRVMIALAIVLEPDVIIADEPTTALDTITAYEVVEQFVKLRERLGSAMIIVSHDMGVVRRIADKVAVIKEGELVERGKTGAIFTGARHPYTRNLVSAKEALSRHYKQLMGGADFADG
ncbi:ABC transporter ATP-binding protein [Paenibacillus sp. NEAU-GSW1]|uniref:staphylopine uptake ABC transporter ATP-binding protein CntD n=1 Tax=Paenibacillus sp. NEAU-GSW1 TaxID=2682486 RepID=UPI0012E0F06A|nr:ABC transporter ATP-binding protein [Paenibacillus sp. NEAU-GSW1]MUT64404.1 ATP-binding cassette domain-containing protein [Paenibacillus sp. NEAU-GSW1]